MGHEHDATRSDTIQRIARTAGFRDSSRVAGDAANASLWETGREADMLAEGDTVFVPDIEPRLVPATTERRHTFVLREEPTFLLVRVVDVRGQGLEGWTYRVEGATGKVEGIIGRAGRLRASIEVDLAEATLALWPPGVGAESDPSYRFELLIGGLEPVVTSRGVLARLMNLGHYVGDVDAALDRGADAMRSFLRDRSDAALDLFCAHNRELLRTAHGC